MPSAVYCCGYIVNQNLIQSILKAEICFTKSYYVQIYQNILFTHHLLHLGVTQKYTANNRCWSLLPLRSGHAVSISISEE